MIKPEHGGRAFLGAFLSLLVFLILCRDSVWPKAHLLSDNVPQDRNMLNLIKKLVLKCRCQIVHIDAW